MNNEEAFKILKGLSEEPKIPMCLYMSMIPPHPKSTTEEHEKIIKWLREQGL